MNKVVQVYLTVFFKTEIEQRFTANGGQSSTKSQHDSMNKLESWYDR